MMDDAKREDGDTWLLLMHQLPAKPSYLRVKVWRRLQGLGAIAVKNSVYVLPSGDQTMEDFQWVAREIEDNGGEAAICQARFVDGIDDDQIRALFRAARDVDYAALAEEAQALVAGLTKGDHLQGEQLAEAEGQLRRLKRRLAQVETIDFFSAPGREALHGLIMGIEARVNEGREQVVEPPDRLADLCGRVWVTRKRIEVDRIASAWLIRRLIDPNARFKFVDAKGYRPEAGELRFDMFEAEFTHVGDKCTFEVLLEHIGNTEAGLRHIAEIVHDIDLKDSKFQREEAAGLAMVLASIGATAASDDERLARGEQLFDGLRGHFSKK